MVCPVRAPPRGTLVSTRSAGALDARSMRTNSVMRLEFISTFAEAVSQHSVSKYDSAFTFSLMGASCATPR